FCRILPSSPRMTSSPPVLASSQVRAASIASCCVPNGPATRSPLTFTDQSPSSGTTNADCAAIARPPFFGCKPTLGSGRGLEISQQQRCDRRGSSAAVPQNHPSVDSCGLQNAPYTDELIRPVCRSQHPRPERRDRRDALGRVPRRISAARED